MSAFLASIQKLLLRDLNKLEQELKLYPNESLLWHVQGDIKNPAGNLALHLCGNLQHYIGANLGGTGYQRNRDAEFATPNLPLSELLAKTAATRAAIEATMPQLKEEEMDLTYPEMVFAEPMTTRHFLIHLTAHLGYHLGQVNYHRRLVSA
jgi:uncharacterized damage-inducible protein DinB